jgi:serine/threonine protein kinase
MIDHVHALPEGYQLQEYTITGILGIGGFGITYKAHDNNLDNYVAIKEYLPGELAVRMDGSTVSAKSNQDQESFEWGLERFLDEARTVFRFNHPHIIHIYRFFKQNGTGYIVMEFVEGQTLSEALRQNGVFTETQIRDWLWPVMDGLQIVHDAGFLHRDIKPQNIMMREDGRPVLLDFGAARQAMGGKTRSLTAIMTPGYAPLEQYQTRGNQGPWTDIYALGAVMYFCITGRKPADVMDRVINDELEPPASSSNNVYPANMIKGISEALSVLESERPQGIREWRKDLDNMDGEQTVRTPVPAPRSVKPEEPTRPMPEVLKPATKLEPDKVPLGERLGALFYSAMSALKGLWSKLSGRLAQFREQRKTHELDGPTVKMPTPGTAPVHWRRRILTPPYVYAFPAILLAALLGTLAGALNRDDEGDVTRKMSDQEVNDALNQSFRYGDSNARPGFVTLQITSNPPGGSVYLDNVFVGQTPLPYSFRSGSSARIRLELTGYQAINQVINVPRTGSGMPLRYNFKR